MKLFSTYRISEDAVQLNTAQIVQLISAVGGVAFSAIVGYRAAILQRQHSQIQSLLDALQADNTGLRNENRALRDELNEMRKEKTP